MKKFENPTQITVYENKQLINVKTVNPEKFPINKKNIARLFKIDPKRFSFNKKCYGISNHNICIVS